MSQSNIFLESMKRIEMLSRVYESEGISNNISTKGDRSEFLNSIKAFSGLGPYIYRSSDLNQAKEKLASLVEKAQNYNLTETDGWFDKVTVQRHNKQLTEAYKVFEKCVNEIGSLQQRMESAYEDIGSIFGKYYDV